MRKLITILLALIVALGVQGESVKNLQKKQQALQKQIENTNKMLNQTKKDEKATLNKLELLGKNIQTKKKLINTLGNEITAIDGEMTELTRQRDSMQLDLEGYKRDYARLVRESHYEQIEQSPMLFLLSSESFQQLVRRVRYMQEFANFREVQVSRIENAQHEIDIQNNTLQAHKDDKKQVLKTRQREQEELTRDEKKHQSMLQDLQKKEKDLGAQLKKQQKRAAEINKKIDQMIKSQTTSKTTLTKEQKLIGGGFEKNKGRLPWPVEKGFISGQFGKHQHPVYKEVVVENKGIYIQTTAGSAARAVYKGQVTSCFQVGSTYAVIIQHGNYRSVYSGLSKLSVKQGDNVEAKQKIGIIYSDPEQDNKTEIYFQIYQGRDIQDPAAWLAK